MKYFKIGVTVLCAILAGCAPKSDLDSVKRFPAVTDHEWFLQEIQLPETSIALERISMDAMGMGELFSLNFEGEEKIIGISNSSQYCASCSLQDDFSIKIQQLSVISEMEERERILKEDDFFDFLGMIERWAITGDGSLMLYNNNNIDNGWINMIFVKR